ILMAASVGLDPATDIRWVTDPSYEPYDPRIRSVAHPSPSPIDDFADGKIDAFLGFPPQPQELRSRRVGHVILDTATDSPWSQDFGCMLVGNREYVRKYPVATKRVVRAILKAADLCASEPALVARRLVDRGFAHRYDYALNTLSDIPYGAWRDYDPEDTVR